MAGGLLLGLFPVNVLHNVIHLVFGVWGPMAARSADGVVAYCRVTSVIYLWLHGVIGVLLTFVGFGWARRVARA
jgi:hypothetical protein